MNRKLLVSFLSVLILSASVVMAEDTTTNETETRPQPPQGVNEFFEKGMTPPDFNSNNKNFTKGQPPQFNGQDDKFKGRRPSKKPDSKPGGDRTPPDWDNSSNGQGQDFQNGQPLQFNG